MALEMQIIDDTPAPLDMTVESAEFDVGGATDFNSLSNRPQYNGVPMTSTTNIPLVPDNLTEIIPSQASTENQLADKDFVNSSIATATAEFVGTFNSIEDLEAIIVVNDNDYGFVAEVDEAGNTVYNRYKYNGGEGWLFEYALNNSSFTAEQWAAIQSGITAQLVEKLNNIQEPKLYDAIGDNADGAMTQKAVMDTFFVGTEAYKSVRIGTNASANANRGQVVIGEFAAAISASSSGEIAIGTSARAERYSVALGSTAKASGRNGVAVGYGAKSTAGYGVAVGYGAEASQAHCVAIGMNAGGSDVFDTQGIVAINSRYATQGYAGNSGNKVLRGVYNGQRENDAVNVSQVNATIDAINEALGVAIPHIGA